MILIFNVGIFSLIVLSTLLLTTGPNRVKLLGWICVAFAVSVFAAPLSIIVRTNMNMHLIASPFHIGVIFIHYKY